ncbi:chaperone protein [Nannochloropsis gaditana]|uniref:Chaperone protein n=1 Tax=Nannochloropsis gaditana TaxID=72520 RepID=W7UCB6_9STRA|nr:chaperone protein [Nannochloropsis gaditana]
MDSPPPRKDYYSVLGVPRDSSDEAIKARYRQLAMDLHPDRCAAGDSSSVERFKAVSEAYKVLSDSGQRRILDEYLEGRRFAGARLRGDEGFLDRLAGIRRPRPPPGSRKGGFSSSRAFHLVEIALSPRVLVMGIGLAFMTYIALGPREDRGHSNDLLVPAWYNQRTKRWETPAPWNPDYRAAGSEHHAKVSKYHVFESAPPASRRMGGAGSNDPV